MVLVFQFVLYADLIYAASAKTAYNAILLKYFFNEMIYYVPAAFIYLSGFHSTLVAFERCLCVVSPLKAQSMIQTKTTAAIIAIGCLVILAGIF